MGKVLENVAADQAQKESQAVLLAFIRQHPEIDTDKNLNLIGEYLDKNMSGTTLTTAQLHQAYQALAVGGQLELESGFFFSAVFKDSADGSMHTFPLGFHTDRRYYVDASTGYLPLTWKIGKGMEFQFYERTEAARAVNAPLPPVLVEPNLYKIGDHVTEGSTKKLAKDQMVVNGIVTSASGIAIRHGDGTGRAYAAPRTDIRDVSSTPEPVLRSSERLIGERPGPVIAPFARFVKASEDAKAERDKAKDKNFSGWLRTLPRGR